MRTLVVEDDALLADGLARVLARCGHTVDRAATGLRADALLRGALYELVILDIGLPGIGGFEVLRRLRTRDPRTSVLMLTARDAVEDRICALDLGADDYLTKPFAVAEFEARVRALLRRTAPAGGHGLGGLHVDIGGRRVTVNDRVVGLTVREWTLLELFLARPGRVLSKDQIAQHLVDDEEQLCANTVEVHVSRLRSKVEPGGVKIRTIRGFGYLWESQPA